MDNLVWDDEFKEVFGIKKPYPWRKYLKKVRYKNDV